MHTVRIIAAIMVMTACFGTRAHAVPAFAQQTGQPCTTCHIGAFGPQLTPFGRAFKIGGYTQRGGDGWQSYVPLAAMVLTSFNHTAASVPADQITPHYNSNNNFALDQISAFLAGGIGDHTGGFVQRPASFRSTPAVESCPGRSSNCNPRIQ